MSTSDEKTKEQKTNNEKTSTTGSHSVMWVCAMSLWPNGFLNLPRSAVDGDIGDTPTVELALSRSAIMYEAGLTEFSSAEVVDEESVWSSVVFSTSNLTLVLLGLIFFDFPFIPSCVTVLVLLGVKNNNHFNKIKMAHFFVYCSCVVSNGKWFS